MGSYRSSGAVNAPLLPAAQVTRVIEEEPRWRHRTVVFSPGEPPQQVVATRWRAFQRHTLEVRAQSADGFHVIGIALKRINIRLSFCGRVVQDGMLMPGMLIVNEPCLAVHGLLRGPTDVLHLHIPNEVIAECARHAHPRGSVSLPVGASTARDPAIERLGMALLGADEFGNPFGRLYADSISIAIVTRLLDTAGKTNPASRRTPSSLASWRLKRVIEYIDANLSESISLMELGSVAGLTRMHFAAQFRSSTGLRPHEYLMRSRVERAQELLRSSNQPIREVALQVGFQNQAHFTTTFKRFVGLPPRAWRAEQGPAPSQGWRAGR